MAVKDHHVTKTRTDRQERLYEEATAQFAAAIARTARGYEADSDLARDLEQEMHLALWTSLAEFREEASLSTWVWRVTHNVGARHVQSHTRMKRKAPLVPLEDIEIAATGASPERQAAESLTLEKLYRLIHALAATDRQVMLLYLEDLDATAIGEVTGLSPGAVATRIHRIKSALSLDPAFGDAS